MVRDAFQVDLRGLVDLLSQHLYSSPTVYLRELVQNAADAVTARRAGEPDCPALVLVVPADVAPDGRLHVLDTGSGLSAADVVAFLATIGASSKRDELGLAREAFLGQFGIGLLSCFLVSDEIDLLTTTGPDAPWTRWVGAADGVYRSSEPSPAALAAELTARAELLAAAAVPHWPAGAGTWVRLRPRRGAVDRTRSGEVERLTETFAQLLPLEVLVARPQGTRRVSRTQRPWDGDDGTGDARPLGERRAQAEALLGVPLLAVIPVQVREAGLTGLVGILGVPTAPTSRQAHHVYAKGMLVGTEVEGVLPDWAFFARALVDTSGLRLTASREALYDDDLLETTRAALGEQLRRWLLRTANVDPVRFDALLRLHEMGIRALAAHDDDLYRVYVPQMTVETTVGPMTVGQFRERFDVVRWTASVDEFRQLLPVAGAQGLAVVNAGYAYLDVLMERLPLLGDDVRHLQVHPGDVDAHIEDVPAAELARFAPFLAGARELLADLDVDVELRSFKPASLPAIVLDDRERQHLRASREAAAEADDVWAGILEALDPGQRAQIRLLLNHDNATVRRIGLVTDEQAQTAAVHALWCQALLLGQRPLRPVDRAVMNRSFLTLLDLALDALDRGQG